MNNPDEVLDRLLNGLRNAEPPAGMETRILQAIGSRVPARSSWCLHAVVAGCLSLAAMWCIATVNLPAPPAMLMYNPPVVVPEITSEAAVRRVQAVKHPHAAPVQVASFPAPPLPLTEQEKLLLRLAHQRDARNEAALNPALHAAQMAKANEQFQQFFDIDDKEMRRKLE